jgi:hypothetical protein
VGVDFSAARDAGRRIWIATLAIETEGARLEDLRRAMDLSEGAVERDAGIAALREHIAAARDAIVGVDAPFSLPSALIEEGTWEAFLRAHAVRFEDAESFRAAMLRRAGGRELKRETDRAARTPFSAYNLRMFRQTHHALRDLLAPLALEGRCAAAPMQETRDGAPVLVEACPASTLKRLGAYAPYKRRGEEGRAARGAILDRLRAEEGLRAGEGAGARMVEDAGGDALDAVIAALAAARASRSPSCLRVAEDHPARLEALVYF